MTLSISGLTSPKSLPTDFTVFTTYDSSNYIIDQSSTDISFNLSCTLPCKTCPSTDTTNCSSCYSDAIITPSIYFNSLTNKCVTTCTNGYYPDAIQLKCLQCNTICSACSGTASNCTSCVTGSGFPYLNISSGSGTCIAACDSGYYPDTNQSPTLCVICVGPCVTCTTQTACLSCNSTTYLYGTSCVTSCPSLTSVNDSSSRKCLPCDSVCASCSILTSNCTSCASTAALYLGSCVNPCPTPLVVKNGQCVACDSPCATCSNTSTNCTSCDSATSTPHLLNNSCVASCPTGYYNESATAGCLLCSALTINCDLCLNKTYCITCNTGYIYYNGQCLTSAPAGYVNISGIAQPCTGDCATCFVIQSNCTSCKTLNLLGNQCLTNCPSNYAPVSGVCTACTSPCLTCSQSVTNCTACITTLIPAVYLSNYQCIQTCPTHTYANNLLSQCSDCQAPCVTCTSQAACLSCNSTTSLYQTSCLTNCPSGFTSIAQVCVSCLTPCQTCSTSQTTCTSCLSSISPSVFLTGSACVIAANCPLNTYPNSTNNQCTACVPPCLSCTTSSSCISCISGYNLAGNTCTSSCLTE
jgi:proprotein convertase subtilisin/kexin type 5